MNINEPVSNDPEHELPDSGVMRWTPRKRRVRMREIVNGWRSGIASPTMQRWLAEAKLQLPADRFTALEAELAQVTQQMNAAGFTRLADGRWSLVSDATALPVSIGMTRLQRDRLARAEARAARVRR